VRVASFPLPLGILVLAAAGCGFPVPAPKGVRAARLTDAWVRIVEEHAGNGYWLVVRGTHVGDQVVAAATMASLSHAALYDEERGEVIEAVGGGVVRTPLRDLLAQAHRLLVIRPEDYSPEAGRRAIARARAQVGRPYDWFGTIGAPDDRRYYCTELALAAYRKGSQLRRAEGIILPAQMADHGEVLFDSGPRSKAGRARSVAASLRARFARVIASARGVSYAAEVTPKIWRGGRPDEKGIAFLAKRGIKTVVNLRHYHGESEGELVGAAGLRYEQIPIDSSGAPTADQIDAFLRISRDPSAQPVYVHCLHGVDRTGAMIAVYRMQEEGWSNADALAEMEHFGAQDILHDLRRFVTRFVPRRATR